MRTFNLERLNDLLLYSRNDPEETMGFKKILVTETAHPYIKYWWPQGHILGWEHSFVHEIHHLFDCICHDKKIDPYGATFYDGVKCNEVTDTVLTSAEEERWVKIED